MLSITNLSKKYSTSNEYAIRDISLEINEGEIVGFLGPNGAGKSTTIKCLMGVLPYSEGNISFNGIDLQENPVEYKKNIGYVSDDHLMYDKLTAREYINFICDIYGVNVHDRKSRTDRLLELFNLIDVYDNQISTYSHGMKQKICVVSALVHKPKLWVMDEPMMGLDPKSAHDLKILMKEHIAEGNSVLFSSHMLEVVEKICDRVAIIDKGKLLQISSVDNLTSEASLEEFFLKVTNSSNDIDNIQFD